MCKASNPQFRKGDLRAKNGVAPVANLVKVTSDENRKDVEMNRLLRLAVAAPSSGSRSPQPTPYAHRILTAHLPPSPTCASRPDGSGPVRRIAPFRSPDKLLFRMPEIRFSRLRCRISAGFRISAHSPIEKPRSILLRFTLSSVGRYS